MPEFWVLSFISVFSLSFEFYSVWVFFRMAKGEALNIGNRSVSLSFFTFSHFLENSIAKKIHKRLGHIINQIKTSDLLSIFFNYLPVTWLAAWAQWTATASGGDSSTNQWVNYSAAAFTCRHRWANYGLNSYPFTEWDTTIKVLSKNHPLTN